jgi:thioredoxin-like negative regulator of GroEL
MNQGPVRSPSTADTGLAADRSPALSQGWRLYGLGELEEARRVMVPVSARAPGDPEAAYLLGMIFKAQGDTALAVKAFAAAKRTAGDQPDRTRAKMLERLAQANIELLRQQTTEGGEASR